MRLVAMAWRNIFRQKRRTLVALSALVVGLCGLVVFQGYIRTMMNGFRDGVIMSGVGHIQIAGGRGYFEDGEFNPYAYETRDWQQRIASIAKERGVLAVFPSTGFTSIAGIGDKSATLLVKGYPLDRMWFEPKTAGSSRGRPEGKFDLGRLVSGALPAGGERDRLVLGETAARILGAKVGDVLTLMVVLPEGGLDGRDFTVAAVYSQAGRDKLFAFTDYDSAADFTGLAGAPVIHVLAKEIGATDSIAAALPGGAAYRKWPQIATYFVQVNTMFNGFLAVIRSIILLITLFVLGNTMNRIVFERMREWGTLRALGTRKRDILVLLLLEGSFLGLAGAAIGIALGFALSALINIGPGIPFKLAGRAAFYIKLHPDLKALWINLIPAVVVAGIASYFPGRRAVALTPSECLRQL
ncbi:MAG: ABC transporter permease [Rectinemataceae bacterium]